MNLFLKCCIEQKRSGTVGIVIKFLDGDMIATRSIAVNLPNYLNLLDSSKLNRFKYLKVGALKGRNEYDIVKIETIIEE